MTTNAQFPPNAGYLLSIGMASVNAAKVLLDSGEKIVVVSSVVPSGIMPWMLKQSVGEQLFTCIAIKLINYEIHALLSKLDVKEGQRVLFWDLYGLFIDMDKNPSKYGFFHVKTPCMSCDALVNSTTSGTVVPDLDLNYCSGLEPAVLLRPFCLYPDSYLFWDESRPTAAGHRHMAADLASLLRSNGLLQ